MIGVSERHEGNLETPSCSSFFDESFVDQILGFQRANLFVGRAEEPNRRTNAVDVRKDFTLVHARQAHRNRQRSAGRPTAGRTTLSCRNFGNSLP